MEPKIIPYDIETGLVTNEFAYWNDANPQARKSKHWQMTSGSFFLKDGLGWTGVPDSIGPNADSSNGNHSQIFRLDSKRADFKNVIIRMKVMNQGLVQSPEVPATAWDGFHIWPRYASEVRLYVVSVNRRSNTCVIKKKLPPGTSNGGTYYPLTKDVPYTVPLGVWQDVEVTCLNLVDFSGVLISLKINQQIIMTCLDNGFIGGPTITEAGRLGFRGDNANLKFDKITVEEI